MNDDDVHASFSPPCPGGVRPIFRDEKDRRWLIEHRGFRCRRSFEVDSACFLFLRCRDRLFDTGDETHIGVTARRVLEWSEREGIYT